MMIEQPSCWRESSSFGLTWKQTLREEYERVQSLPREVCVVIFQFLVKSFTSSSSSSSSLVKCGIKRLNKKTSFVRLLFVIPFFLFFVRLKRGGGAVCQTTKSKIGKKREKEREVFSLFLQIHSFLFPRNSLSLISFSLP